MWVFFMWFFSPLTGAAPVPMIMCRAIGIDEKTWAVGVRLHPEHPARLHRTPTRICNRDRVCQKSPEWTLEKGHPTPSQNIACLDPCHPKPPLTKPPFPVFRFFGFFLALTVHTFRIFFVCSMPGVDPHVPHILWIEHEENWDDWLCQGWVWVQPTTKSQKGHFMQNFCFLAHKSSRVFFGSPNPFKSPQTIILWELFSQ